MCRLRHCSLFLGNATTTTTVEGLEVERVSATALARGFLPLLAQAVVVDGAKASRAQLVPALGRAEEELQGRKS